MFVANDPKLAGSGAERRSREGRAEFLLSTSILPPWSRRAAISLLSMEVSSFMEEEGGGAKK